MYVHIQYTYHKLISLDMKISLEDLTGAGNIFLLAAKLFHDAQLYCQSISSNNIGHKHLYSRL